MALILTLLLLAGCQEEQPGTATIPPTMAGESAETVSPPAPATPMADLPATPSPPDATPEPPPAPTITPTATPIGRSPRPSDEEEAAAEAAAAEAAAAAARQPATHTVARGETLSQIAERYGVRTADLARANAITNPDRLLVGTVLQIPGAESADSAPATPTPAPERPTTYVVQRGDQLGRIAERFGVSMSALAAANNITNPNTIYVGQTLTIPPVPNP
jgi:LysM repeat protein